MGGTRDDTGATQSCIDVNLAESLGLPVVDSAEITGVGGSETHNVYLASVAINTLAFSQYGKFDRRTDPKGGTSTSDDNYIVRIKLVETKDKKKETREQRLVGAIECRCCGHTSRLASNRAIRPIAFFPLRRAPFGLQSASPHFLCDTSRIGGAFR